MNCTGCGLDRSYEPSDPQEVTLYLGDETWHDGPGWYYVIDEYPDEGSCGAFETREAAEAHARQSGCVPT